MAGDGLKALMDLRLELAELLEPLKVQVVGAIDPRSGEQLKGKPHPQVGCRTGQFVAMPQRRTLVRTAKNMQHRSYRWCESILCSVQEGLIIFDHSLWWMPDLPLFAAGVLRYCRDFGTGDKAMCGVRRRSIWDSISKGRWLLYSCCSRDVDDWWPRGRRSLCHCRSPSDVAGMPAPNGCLEWSLWTSASSPSWFGQPYSRRDFCDWWLRISSRGIWLVTWNRSHWLARFTEVSPGWASQAQPKFTGGGRCGDEYAASGILVGRPAFCLHWSSRSWSRRIDDSGSLAGCRGCSTTETGWREKHRCLWCIGG